MGRTVRVFWRLVAALLLGMAPGVAAACTVTTGTTPPVSTSLGSYSPAAVNAGVVPSLKSFGGLTCTPSTLVLLANNYIRAKFHSNGGLKLKNAAGNTIAYTASPDAGATVAFTQDGTVDYMQNNLLNVLGLLGGSSASFPFYVKPTGGAVPPVGTYSDRILITWNWYLCQGLSATLVCVGTPDTGSGTTTIDVTLDVSVKSVVLTTSVTTTWDPVNGTSNPKALPGSRRRWSITAYNPDLVPLDLNSVALTLPTPARESFALDGDGTGSSTVFGFTDGSPASGLTFSYQSPGSTTDNVDFAADSAMSDWSYAPGAGDSVSQAAITAVRLRPQGRMPAGSRFTVTLPTILR